MLFAPCWSELAATLGRASLVLMRDALRPLLKLLLLIAFAACGTTTGSPGTPLEGPPTGDPSKDPSQPPSSPTNPFAPDVAATRVVFEIDYQAGAEPYVGDNPGFGPQWTLFETNLAKLLEGSGKTSVVPTTLDGMERLDDVSGQDHDAAAIFEIAGRHRATQSGGDILAYYVVWLDGYYAEAGKRREEVLGVAFGNGIIAMFKPVIAKSALPLLPNVSRVVEQVVLVHEVGHAIGLVNNGIPLASPHQDGPNGAHCTNDRCVMYFSVEGVEAAREFAQRRVTSSNLIIFDDACLADVAAARR